MITRPVLGLVAIVVGVGACSSAGSMSTATPRPHHHDSAGSNRASRSPSTPKPTPTFSPAQPLVSAAHWVHYPEGWRIEVMPSIYGRNHSPQAVGQTLAEALHLAPPPMHLTRTMRRSLDNQLRCHADFAPRKQQWDLESWRPNVGYYRTVEALCNPGGGF